MVLVFPDFVCVCVYLKIVQVSCGCYAMQTPSKFQLILKAISYNPQYPCKILKKIDNDLLIYSTTHTY